MASIRQVADVIAAATGASTNVTHGIARRLREVGKIKSSAGSAVVQATADDIASITLIALAGGQVKLAPSTLDHIGSITSPADHKTLRQYVTRLIERGIAGSSSSEFRSLIIDPATPWARMSFAIGDSNFLIDFGVPGGGTDARSVRRLVEFDRDAFHTLIAGVRHANARPSRPPASSRCRGRRHARAA